MLLTITTRRARHGQQPVQQQASQRERPEVVDRERALKAVPGPLVPRVDAAWVVDQQVDARDGEAGLDPLIEVICRGLRT